MPRRRTPDWETPEMTDWMEDDYRDREDRCLPLAAVFIGLAAICNPRRYCWPRSTCRPYACTPMYVCWPAGNCFPRPCYPRVY